MPMNSSSCNSERRDELSTTTATAKESETNNNYGNSQMTDERKLQRLSGREGIVKLTTRVRVPVTTVKRPRRKATKRRKSTPISIGTSFRSFQKESIQQNGISNGKFGVRDGDGAVPRTTSPTFNRSSTVTPAFSALSRFKRRSGLVRRTHSPVNASSPVAKSVYQFIASKTNLPYIKMGSKAVPISDSIGSQLIPRPLGGDQRILHKKRKRCNSPKNSVSSRSSSRSRSPNSRPNRIDASPKEHRLDLTDSIQVKMVSPTLRGMTESARILRYDGIFSFPTETMYSLVSFIPFARQNKDESRNPTNSNGHWKTLMRLKARDTMKTQRSNSDPPLLYIHRPDYADNYVSFSKLKTFVYKQQLPIETEDQKKDEETKNKFTAVTFSESREVMKSLTSAFWPGPVTIFAPAQRVRSRSRSSNSFTSQASKVSESERSRSRSSNSFTSQASKVSESEQEVTSKIPHIITSSCSSLTSLASESVECDSDDQPPILSTNDDDTEDTSPILPVSALRTLNSLLGNDESDDDTYCIGMRCPSHPLARRILEEVYGEKDEKKNHPKSRRRIPGAVVGFNASIPITAPLPYSCKDVCSSLLYVQDHHKLTSTNPDVQKPIVHVLNGEDRREMFFVPTCQYGQSSSLSLVIDAPNRTIHLLRDKSYLNSKKINADFDLKAADIVRALRHRREDEPGCVKSKAITGVMQKWKVCEKEI